MNISLVCATLSINPPHLHRFFYSWSLASIQAAAPAFFISVFFFFYLSLSHSFSPSMHLSICLSFLLFISFSRVSFFYSLILVTSLAHPCVSMLILARGEKKPASTLFSLFPLSPMCYSTITTRRFFVSFLSICRYIREKMKKKKKIMQKGEKKL